MAVRLCLSLPSWSTIIHSTSAGTALVRSAESRPRLPVSLWLITAYCACFLCVGPNTRHGLTKSGAKPRANWTIACPPQLPLGTILWIGGIGERMCQDRGRAIKGKRLDLYMTSHKRATKFGKQQRVVKKIKRGG